MSAKLIVPAAAVALVARSIMMKLPSAPYCSKGA